MQSTIDVPQVHIIEEVVEVQAQDVHNGKWKPVKFNDQAGSPDSALGSLGPRSDRTKKALHKGTNASRDELQSASDSCQALHKATDAPGDDLQSAIDGTQAQLTVYKATDPSSILQSASVGSRAKLTLRDGSGILL